VSAKKDMSPRRRTKKMRKELAIWRPYSVEGATVWWVGRKPSTHRLGAGMACSRYVRTRRKARQMAQALAIRFGCAVTVWDNIHEPWPNQKFWVYYPPGRNKCSSCYLAEGCPDCDFTGLEPKE
jgi:hypothetical protein